MTSITKTFATAIATVALLIGGGASALASSVATNTSSIISLAKAPCYVTSWSDHAAREMAKDRISNDYVEDVVYKYCSKAKKQTNGRYRYTDGKIVVIVEPDGEVVTVWRR